MSAVEGWLARQQEVEVLLRTPGWEHQKEAARLFVEAGDDTNKLLRVLIHLQFAAVKTAITYGEEPAR
jgi:hypothetical protein